MKFIATLASCVTLVAAEPTKRPTAEEMKALALKMAVDVISTKDGTPQKVVYYQPESAAKNLSGPAVPLLVFLHTWSGSIEQGPMLVGLAKQRGWVMVAPDFRGVNNQPEACASDLASQDVVDAVDYAQSHARIDPERWPHVTRHGHPHPPTLGGGERLGPDFRPDRLARRKHRAQERLRQDD
jgi:predicted alpha/beta-fold hydrolase